MKKILHTLLLGSLLGPAITMAQSPTAPALNFNVFLQHNANLINNETEGPLALGGDLTVGGGYQVSTNDPGTFFVDGVRVTLLIGGKVNYSSGMLQVNQNGYVKIGNCIGSTVWYTDPNGAYPPIRITPGSDYNGMPRILLQASSLYFGSSASVKPVCQGGIVDFNSAFATMRAYSDTMSHYTDNAHVTNSGGTPIPHTGLPSQIKVTMHADLNVLNVTGADLNHVTDFIYNNHPSASQYFVINVNAPGTFNWSVPNSGGIGFYECPYILWNFYNTDTLNIVGYGAVEGTIFAPRADIIKTANMANVEGQVIAKSYHHAGGENHYAVFSPGLPGCGGLTPPDASFTVNSTTQCLVCNNFVFTNTSTGSPTLSYLWTFADGTTSTLANPSKTYTATGTYPVKLVATNGAGTDSVTHSITVAGDPAHGFTVNDSSQPFTGNSFVFTSATPTFGNLYSWTFGDGGTSTAANPAKVYSAAGIYTVTQSVIGPGGCSVTTSMTVTVETDSVGGGGGGGLESESLGGLVSRREYNKIKASISKHPDYSALPLFTKHAAYAAAKGTDGSASVLQRFVPATLDAGTEARITSPEDLKTITAAVDVFSVDYTKNNVPKAVVLGIATTGKPYNHTKSICDRFRGATLLGTKVVTINGCKLIEFALRQDNGEIEHSITFAAGKSPALAAWRLQAKWLISEYVQDDSIFNFQVWGATPASAEKLAKDIITNLQAELPVQQIDNDQVASPRAYLASGKRHREYIDVTINSTTQSFNAKMVFFQKLNELSGDDDSLIIPFNIAAGDSNHFRIPIYDGYEYDGHLYLNDTLVDNVYMADGNWSLDYDKTYTEIINYKPENDPNRVYPEDEYPVYRSVKVSANTTDYISIYKFIRAGQEKTDLSAYHSYKFFAQGEGKMDVILLKESVTRFADHYKTTVKLNPAGANYQVSFADFTSDNLSAPFDASDVTAVVYQFTMDGVATDFNFQARDQAFSPAEVPSIKALSSKVVTVFPNPAAGKFQVKFLSEEARDMDITLTDMTGKLVYKMPVHANMGQNVADITLPSTMPQTLLFVQVGNKEVKYNITKLSVLK